MEYNRYPQYKDSGIEWLGELPKHWNTASLRWITERYAGGTPDKRKEDYWENGTIPWLNSGAVNQGTITEPSTYITEDAFLNSSAKWVPKRALLMALAGQGKTKGMVAQTNIRTTCNQSMAAIVPYGITPRYLFWWLSSQYRNIRGLAGDGLRDGLNLEMLGSIPCPLPNIDEQESITTILDRETTRIDALIEKKQRLIELLKEKRQAVITQAVTKGLDPNVPMKDSGVEWLGEVPEHWNVAKLKRVTGLVGGFAFNSDDFEPEGIQLLRIGNVYQSKLSLERQPVYMPETFLELYKRFAVYKGDLLVSMTGTIGKRDYGFAVKTSEDGPFLLNQRVGKFLIDNEKITTDYLEAVLHSDHYLNELYSLPFGTKQANLSNDDILSIEMAFPPTLAEQIQICDYISEHTVRIDNILAKSDESIDLMIEHRSALITAAVTGQIDVRNLA
jgi:type I restriction enzyme S subunit